MEPGNAVSPATRPERLLTPTAETPDTPALKRGTPPGRCRRRVAPSDAWPLLRSTRQPARMGTPFVAGNGDDLWSRPQGASDWARLARE